MDKGKLDRNSPIQVFETKTVRKELGFKITAADVYNDFLYLGDDKGKLSIIKVISTFTLSKSTILKSFLNLLKSKARTSLSTK